MVVGDMEMNVDVAVIGAGPGGYSAAFRAADLGLEVALIDSRDTPGGVCLHEGCIPSKTYLQLVETILESRRVQKRGVSFGEPVLDIPAMVAWKEAVVKTLAAGLQCIGKKRDVQYIKGLAVFENSSTLRLQRSEYKRIVFKHAIIATGSAPRAAPGFENIPEKFILDSTQALSLEGLPCEILVVGGGYIGLELGTVFATLGCKVHVAEIKRQLLSGVDSDLVAPLQAELEELFASIALQTEISRVSQIGDRLEVYLKSDGGERKIEVDKVLMAIGRYPASTDLGLENTRVQTDKSGRIKTDEQMKTGDDNIYAVGDVAGEIMLAHTAIREGRVAAEAITGLPAAYDVQAVPAVIYTEPQIAWCGITETDAKSRGIEYSVERFPWRYSGRAQTMDDLSGFTKILAESGSGRILGAAIVGRMAESLISEFVLAIEMGATVEDLALTLHPHPTLSEAGGEAAEMFLGSPTHVLPRK